MSNKSLNKINNELKGYINEASGISDKCKMKLITLVEKHFFVDLPNSTPPSEQTRSYCVVYTYIHRVYL